MKNKIWKQAISFLLVFLLTFELIPAWVFAEDGDASEEGEVLFDDDIIVEEFADNIASSEKAEIVEEIPTRRDEYQKEFIMASGMNLITVYPVAVHYDKDGEWEEIDNTLIPAAKEGEEGEEAYRNTSGIWDVTLPAEIGVWWKSISG